jgi:cysteine desulfurase
VARPIYLDHQATNPPDPRVVEAMRPFLAERFGNPASRHHAYGWEAEEAVEAARAKVADLVGADPKEVVFTSGGVEADNLAVKGVAGAYATRGRHAVTTAIENRPVLDSMRWLDMRRGFAVTAVGCDEKGRVAADDVLRAVRADTVLVSMHWANHEVGTVQPVEEVAAGCVERRVLLHVDASQAAGWLPVDLGRVPIALLSLSADLLHGPKGAGALVVRRRSPRTQIEPLVHGGAHERDLRGGLQDVAAIVGFGAAAAIARAEREADAARVSALRDRLEAALLSALPDAVVYGDRARRLPGSLSVGFPGAEAEALLVSLPDLAASTGGGCFSAGADPSHVLSAMGVPRPRAAENVRLSLGRLTTSDDVDRASSRIVETVRRLRSLAAVPKP